MHKFTWLGGLGVLSVALVGAVVAIPGSSSPDSPLPARSRPTAAASTAGPRASASHDSEVVHMRQSVRSLQRQIDRLSDAQAIDHAPSNDDESLPSPPERQPLTREQTETFYDVIFDEQRVDVSWKIAMEAELTDAFGSERLAALRLDSLECRTTLCKLEVGLDHPDDRDVLLAALGAPPFDRGGYFHPTDAEDGYVVFTGRAGFSLPRPEADEP